MRELFRQAVKAAIHRAFDYGPLTETFHRTEELQNLQTATRLVGTMPPEHLRSSFKACYHSGWGDVFYVIAANAKTKPEDARRAWDLALITYSMHSTPEKARTFLETRLKSYDQSMIPEHEDIFVRTAMVSKIQSDNALTKQAQAWKKGQGIISLTIEEMEEKAKDKGLIIEQKVDGQSSIMDFKDGSVRFASLDGRLMWDFPLSDEIAGILKKKGIHQATAVGEMAGYDKGKILSFNESQSIIKNAKSDKDKIHWFPYQLLSLNGEKIDDDFEIYKKTWPRLTGLFRGAKHVHPVEYYEGGIPALKKAWKKLVEQDENEGIVVRTSDNKVYKAKPIFTYDLVILAVGDKKGKNWPKKQIGTALMAFMDSDGVFRVAGEVSSGLNHEEQAELFSWAQKTKVDEDEHHVWVKPQKIMEIQWERTTIKPMPAYKYSRGKYEKLDKRTVGTIVKPRFIRYRKDKSVTPSDLRLTQIPNWKDTSKMAMRIVKAYLESQNA